MSTETPVDRLCRSLAQERGRWAPPPPRELAAAVARLSELYTRRRVALAREVPGVSHLAARMHFFLPRDLAKVTSALHRLAREGWRLDAARPRVLDLGAGLGASTLGAAAFLADDPVVKAIEVQAWDTDPVALEAMQHVVRQAPQLGLPPIVLTTQARSLARLPATGTYDLILAGLVLNELADDVEARAELLTRLSARLAKGGLLLVVEPALRTETRALMAVRDRLAASPGPPYVLGPCLHEGPCPLRSRERDWCHAELPGELPDALAKIAAAAGLRRSRLTYAWLGLSSAPVARSRPGARVVSGPLRSKGKLELDVCHAGGLTRLMRLDREQSPANAALSDLGRGDRLWLEGAEWTAGRLRLRSGVGVRGDRASGSHER